MRYVFRPRSVHVRIAAGCNLGCFFCEREALAGGGNEGRKKRGTVVFTDGRDELPVADDMSPETWAHVKEKVFPHVDHVELGGLGEPTLGAMFCQAAKDVIEAGKSLFFFTNGHYLDLPRVLESVGESPHVSVSIDAGTPEGYSRMRKGNLAHLVKSVKAFKAAKPGSKVDSQFTAMASNIEELAPWVELCAELGIGRKEHGEQLLMVPADHHVTDRVEESLRFLRDKTLENVAKARIAADAAGLNLVVQMPEFSTANPNAIIDNTDPRKIRRWADIMFYGLSPCGGTSPRGTTGTTGPHLTSITAARAFWDWVVTAETTVTNPPYLTVPGGTTTVYQTFTTTPATYFPTTTNYGGILNGTAVAGFALSNPPGSVASTTATTALDHTTTYTATGVNTLGYTTTLVGITTIQQNQTNTTFNYPPQLTVPNYTHGNDILYKVNEVQFAVEQYNGTQLNYITNVFVTTALGITTTVTDNVFVTQLVAALVDVAFVVGEVDVIGYSAKRVPPPPDVSDEPPEFKEVPKEMYVDYDGTAWSCLARLKIGDFNVDPWAKIVDDNASYQLFLANFYYVKSGDNSNCRACPRRD